MKRDEVKVIRLGTDYMDEEQRSKFYEVLEKLLRGYGEKLEEDRLKSIEATRRAQSNI